MIEDDASFDPTFACFPCFRRRVSTAAQQTGGHRESGLRPTPKIGLLRWWQVSKILDYVSTRKYLGKMKIPILTHMHSFSEGVGGSTTNQIDIFFLSFYWRKGFLDFSFRRRPHFESPGTWDQMLHVAGLLKRQFSRFKKSSPLRNTTLKVT